MDALFKCTETVVENELVTLSDTQSGFMISVSITVVLQMYYAGIKIGCAHE